MKPEASLENAVDALEAMLREGVPHPDQGRVMAELDACAKDSRDGATLAAGGNDNIVRVWDVAQSRLQRTLDGHTWVVLGLQFARDGKHLFSASLDETLRVWDVETGKERASYKPLTPTVQPENVINGRGILSIAKSPDGNLLAVGGYDRNVKVWEASALIPNAK